MASQQLGVEDLQSLVAALGAEEALGNLTIPDLKSYCKRFGLRVTGGKLELIGQLSGYLDEQAQEEKAPSEGRKREPKTRHAASCVDPKEPAAEPTPAPGSEDRGAPSRKRAKVKAAVDPEATSAGVVDVPQCRQDSSSGVESATAADSPKARDSPAMNSRKRLKAKVALQAVAPTEDTSAPMDIDEATTPFADAGGLLEVVVGDLTEMLSNLEAREVSAMYAAATQEELREHCTRMRLSAAGQREALVGRLEGHLKRARAASSSAAARAAPRQHAGAEAAGQPAGEAEGGHGSSIGSLEAVVEPERPTDGAMEKQQRELAAACRGLEAASVELTRSVDREIGVLAAQVEEATEQPDVASEEAARSPSEALAAATALGSVALPSGAHAEASGESGRGEGGEAPARDTSGTDVAQVAAAEDHAADSAEMEDPAASPSSTAEAAGIGPASQVAGLEPVVDPKSCEPQEAPALTAAAVPRAAEGETAAPMDPAAPHAVSTARGDELDVIGLVRRRPKEDARKSFAQMYAQLVAPAAKVARRSPAPRGPEAPSVAGASVSASKAPPDASKESPEAGSAVSASRPRPEAVAASKLEALLEEVPLGSAAPETATPEEELEMEASAAPGYKRKADGDAADEMEHPPKRISVEVCPAMEQGTRSVACLGA